MFDISKTTPIDNFMPVTSATVYFTSLCNSGCQTCDIWKETKREEFPLEAFKEIIKLPWLKDTVWALIGGEFTVYSKYIEAIKALNDAGKDYYFITNGILPKKIQKVYEHTTIKNLSLSLDAFGEEHDRLRGAPHNFKKITEIIDWVKANHRETRVRVCYTMSNFNTRQDLKNVIAFAREKNIDLKLGIATNAEFFQARTEKSDITLTTDELYQFEDLVNKGDQYLQLYRAWKRGYTPPCDSIREHLVLMYNGDVMLCEAKMVKLGNIFELEDKTHYTPGKALTNLWHSAETRRTLEDYRTCNDCWMSCMRKMDAKRQSVDKIKPYQAVYGYLNYRTISDLKEKVTS